ncbi:MAG: PQQ-binding-like beta-propeller repeat protein [Pseudomonadota bacterium]
MQRLMHFMALVLVFSATAEADGLLPDNTNWLNYNYNVNGERYAPLDQINKETAQQLSKVCSLKVEDIASFHTSILHVDGLLYFTTPTDTVAVDSSNCKQVWRHTHVEERVNTTVVRTNRGVAYANGRVFRGTVDSQLIALDATTGELLWQHRVGEPAVGEFFSAAPQVYQGLVLMGAAGGDWGIRGRMMAYDAVTGREVWRFYTIPRGDEPGADTWKDASSARIGGGGTWTTFSLDVSAGEVFVPVGNPAPDLLPDKRPGENLFTNSLVVLDANTGKLKWYYQLLSNDGQDLDLGAAPVLYYNSDGERVVAFGSKDGYVYGVSRENHERLFKTEVTTIKNAGVAPTPDGVDVCPGPLGGVEWNGPALDRDNHQLIVGSVDWCATLKSNPEFVYKPGDFAFGGSFEFLGSGAGWIYALNADSGEVTWRRKTEGPHVAGITPTAGGVTFTGDMAGNFWALDSSTGEALYETKVNGGLAGGVITYMRDAKQYVALVAGNVSRITWGDVGAPTLHIFSLSGDKPVAETKEEPQKKRVPPPVNEKEKVSDKQTVNEPSTAKSTTDAGAPVAPAKAVLKDPPQAVSAAEPVGPAANLAAGAALYAKVCAACHGGKGEGAIGPTLAGIAERLDHAKRVEWIKNPSAKMPRFYPGMLNEQAVVDVAAYLGKL